MKMILLLLTLTACGFEVVENKEMPSDIYAEMYSQCLATSTEFYFENVIQVIRVCLSGCWR